MSKPTGRLSETTPEAAPIQWKLHQGDLNTFVTEVLQTLGKEGFSVWYPITAYTLRMVQAARWRLWQNNGCALRCRTDVASDRLYVRADFSTARAFGAWTNYAGKLGVKPGRVLRMIRGGKRRKVA